MNELVAALKVYLANSYEMYFLAHGFHWNVEGRDFQQYHDFFGGIYEEVYDTVDDTAENIRKLGEYAPSNFKELLTASSVPETSITGTAISSMLSSLEAANAEVMDSIRAAYNLANTADEIGLSNYLQDRYDQHAKIRWKIRSASK